MGYHMAGHLASAGHRVTVYNRTRGKGGALARRIPGTNGGHPGGCRRERGSGVRLRRQRQRRARDQHRKTKAPSTGMRDDAVFVDHTTASAALARELDVVARERGLHFLDAPVSGGEAGAVNGVLTVMVGGEATDFDGVKDAIDAYARAVTLMGPAGLRPAHQDGQSDLHRRTGAGAGRGLSFAQRVGLDGKQVVDVISKGAAQSWQMRDRGATMLDDEFEFGFAVEWMRKDLAICMAEARRVGARLPVAALVDQFYAEVQASGGSRWDTSSLMRLLTRP